ncbi:hypothetical protein TIFTF001_025079 [Ficus carica]|uniref:Uncharacterized protein n=1 Tax=Ficus carica TaxID=3494 RepID=A0AA88AN55_FICCA|nr:hypothetical protein TIFTF001_025079 [Ficus carica]
MVKTPELIASRTVRMMRAGRYVSRRSNSLSLSGDALSCCIPAHVFQPLPLSPSHHRPSFCIQGLR